MFDSDVSSPFPAAKASDIMLKTMGILRVGILILSCDTLLQFLLSRREQTGKESNWAICFVDLVQLPCLWSMVFQTVTNL